MLASTAFAQSGAITGRVTNDDKVGVAKAKVQARNTATGAVFTADTDAGGNYKLAALPAGIYELSASGPSLEPFQKKVTVPAGEALQTDILLHFDVQANTLGDNPGDLFNNLVSKKAPPTGPAPRMPDGKPDLSGVWLPSFPTDPGKPDPLPWAAALIEKRNANQNADIPSSHCLPLGVIMSTFLFPYQFVQTSKELVILYEGEPSRQIYMDGRGHPDDPNPSWLGHSIAHWEGDALVVDTVGFNGKPWVGFGGQPSTDKLHITERYTRPDLGHLATEITVDDPGAYARPWTMKKISSLATNYELMEFICNEGERDLQHMAK